MLQGGCCSIAFKVTCSAHPGVAIGESLALPRDYRKIWPSNTFPGDILAVTLWPGLLETKATGKFRPERAPSPTKNSSLKQRRETLILISEDRGEVRLGLCSHFRFNYTTFRHKNARQYAFSLHLKKTIYRAISTCVCVHVKVSRYKIIYWFGCKDKTGPTRHIVFKCPPGNPHRAERNAHTM